MSSFYYKVVPPPDKPTLIGYKKVNHGELQGIVSRLARPKLAWTPYTLHGPDGKLSSAGCATNRPNSGGTQVKTPQKLTEQELQRLLRRIQRPTISHQMSRQGSDVDSSRPSTAPPHGSSGERLKRIIQQLSRPTTASRAKRSTECHLCDEAGRELNRKLVPFEYAYADEKVVSEDEASAIVKRVSSPTKASERGGGSACVRLPPDYDVVHAQSPNLPLLSGLTRSRSVHHVVNRLHHNRSVCGSAHHQRPPSVPTQGQ
ncbi:unnamed protein product [Lymnaea stagnalis]|uniref:Uncharacterized protein n=1 Tax=Lymnaea stagnalis TaxID=6523 RepID=A0AAV2IA51_LYMST